MSRWLAPVITLMLCACLSAGCGASAPNRPAVRSQAQIRQQAHSGGGDQIVLTINGQSFEARESGSEQVRVSGAPELDHDGPIGCRGRYFAVENGPFDFRYTAHEAWLLYQQTRLYTFGEPPHRRSGDLVWSAKFGADRVSVRVQCPLPRA